jgi:hypothetical protein
MVTKGGRPLVKKGKIVKRTQGWKGNLQDRIEGLLEDYESKTGYWKGKQQERDEAPEPEKDNTPPPPPAPLMGSEHRGTFAKDRSGAWLAKIPTQGSRGDDAVLATQGGREARVVLDQKMWSGRDRYTGNYAELWTFERRGGSRYASAEDITKLLVVERALLAGVSND